MKQLEFNFKKATKELHTAIENFTVAAKELTQSSKPGKKKVEDETSTLRKRFNRLVLTFSAQKQYPKHIAYIKVYEQLCRKFGYNVFIKNTEAKASHVNQIMEDGKMSQAIEAVEDLLRY